MRRGALSSSPRLAHADVERRLWGGYHLWRAVADLASGRPGWAAYQALRAAGFRRRSGRR